MLLFIFIFYYYALI